MKRFRTATMMLTFLAVGMGMNSRAKAQEMPVPGPEFDVFHADLGKWDVEIRVWDGSGEPKVSKGEETNRMLGGFWMLTDFQGNMMGLDFRGHGIYSYDDAKKQYIGTWIDSLGPTRMEMVGQYDRATKTMTYEGIGPAPDGSSTKHVMVTKYDENGTRVMTMQMQAGERMTKVFEMHYSKARPEPGS